MKPEDLKKKRQAMQMEMGEFAAALKTPYGTYYKWEKGQRRIPGIAEVAIDGLEFKRANITTRG